MSKSPYTNVTDEEWLELRKQHLRSGFELDFEDQVERLGKVAIRNQLPIQYFSFALVECRDMFVAGHYYGCITLCQSVAEGIAKFLIDKNPAEFQAAKVSTRIDGGPYTLANNLHRAGVISADSKAAFLRITGQDRNDFHHLNHQVPTDVKQLEARALECLAALNVVESEVFAYDVKEGVIFPKIPKYWQISADGQTMSVYTRSM